MAAGNTRPTGTQDWAFDFGEGRPEAGFRIRSVTLGAPLGHLEDFAALDRAVDVLETAKRRLEAAGYEVQTLRIATPPLWRLTAALPRPDMLEALATLERRADARGVLIGVGPLAESGKADEDTLALARELASSTERVCFSLPVATADAGADPVNLAVAGRIASALAQDSENGEAAFRFAAAACCPPGIPFFPAAFHEGPPALSIGLEAAHLIADAIEDAAGHITPSIARRLDFALQPLEDIVEKLAAQSEIAFRGIDTSPAPMRSVSIAAPLERLSGTPFGGPGTLAACAAVTVGLKRSRIRRCGFSGLMLPLLEDDLLARRAAEGRYGLQDLLTYSSVCGTGLDTVPVPGDSTPESLARIIGDMAALAATYDKPLVARLLPVPGKAAGDSVSFASPFLTDSRVLPLDGRLASGQEDTDS